MKIKYILLILILVFSAFIRLYKINTLPPSLFYDELDAGYQALIFNKNNADYYGNKFPVHFRSFGDYRTSLHIYSIALFQKLTGNAELSIRLPSAIYGVLSVLVFFLITKSLVPSFLLAISPWALHYSRIGFEVSGMLLFVLLGIMFWQRYLTKKRLLFLYLSILSFCLTPYFYSTAKLFLVIIFFLIVIIWHQHIFKLGLKKIILTLIFVGLLLSPIAIDTLKGKSGFRFSYISIFTEPHREQVVDNFRYQDGLVSHPHEIGVKTSLQSFIFHNKYQLVFRRFISNFISSFSSTFLFLTGDNNVRHGFGNHGLLYIIDSIMIFMGIFYAFLKKKDKKLSTFFLWLLLLSPIPYALTRDVDFPHATRLILMLPSIIYFSFIGIKFLQLKNRFLAYFSLALYGISFLSFWHYYNYQYPNDSARDWNTGMKEVVTVTNSLPDQPIIFSDKYTSFVSFFLFYHPYMLKPSDSITNHLVKFGNSSFDGQVLDNKYYFGQVNWTNLTNLPKNVVIVVSKSEYGTIPQSQFTVLKNIPKVYINQEEFLLLKLK